LHLTNRLSLDCFIQIYKCDIEKYRVYLNSSNAEVFKKFNEISRSQKTVNKFVLVIEAVKLRIDNKTQFNWEGKCDYGDIYAIKVDNHRFYTIIYNHDGYRNLYICRYGRKQSNSNDKTLTGTIDSISKIEIQIFFSNE
jgi:hypothetical protein